MNREQAAERLARAEREYRAAQRARDPERMRRAIAELAEAELVGLDALAEPGGGPPSAGRHEVFVVTPS